MATVDTRGRYRLRRNLVSRRVLTIAVLLAVAGFSAAVMLPTRALAGATGTTTTGTATTTTTQTTTTTKKKPSYPVESTFPAAGGLVVRSVRVRKKPNPRAHVIKVMHQFRSDYREQEVLAVGAARGDDGRLWYRLSLPMRPNNSTGWVPASRVALHHVVNRIVVDIDARRLQVLRGKQVLYSTTVAVGAPGMETPVGHFYVQVRFHPDDPFLGVFAFETSAYSNLSEWPGGGVVGIHGDFGEPQKIPGDPSHGCVRMRDGSLVRLARIVAVGTPVTIVR